MDSMFFLNESFNGVQCVDIHNIMEVTFGLPSIKNTKCEAKMTGFYKSFAAHNYRKSPFFMGKIHFLWPFSSGFPFFGSPKTMGIFSFPEKSRRN